MEGFNHYLEPSSDESFVHALMSEQEDASIDLSQLMRPQMQPHPQIQPRSQIQPHPKIKSRSPKGAPSKQKIRRPPPTSHGPPIIWETSPSCSQCYSSRDVAAIDHHKHISNETSHPSENFSLYTDQSAPGGSHSVEDVLSVPDHVDLRHHRVDPRHILPPPQYYFTKGISPEKRVSKEIIQSARPVTTYTPTLIKIDPPTIRIPPLKSVKMVGEMCTLYLMSLLRDVPFDQWELNDTLRKGCHYLNQLPKYSLLKGPVTVRNIFRCPMYGSLHGPYISQFLYRDIGVGAQKYTTEYDATPRYLQTGRDLAWRVHGEDLLLPFQNARYQLNAWKVPTNVSSGLSLECLMMRVSLEALGIAESLKWDHLFLRPEEYTDLSAVLYNRIMHLVHTRQGNHTLTQVYPEGAPSTPSLPSGYAALVGACTTLLKFWYDPMAELEIHVPRDTMLVANGQISTIGDELDKMASNLSMGRCWAGVNYVMDIYAGLKLGEKIAIAAIETYIPGPYNVPLKQFNDRLIMLQK